MLNSWEITKEDDSYPKIVIFVLILLLVFQRISIPFKDNQIPSALILIYIFLFYSLFHNKIKINIVRLVFYILSSTLAISVTLLSKEFSDFSILYLLAIYAPFVFYADLSYAEYLKIIGVFQKFMVFASLLGIIQLLIQFFGVQYFDLFSFLPSEFVQEGYNTSYPLVYGSNICKSNGIIFLEPSFFSQLLAISLVIEFIYFHRIYRMILLIVAIFCTFSGTGILLLAITFPFWVKYLFQRKLALPFFGVMLLLILVAVFGPADITSSYLSRITEIGTSGSSANMRFIAPYTSMNSFFGSRSIWLGLGAGAVTGLENVAQANFPVIPKLVIEYGVLTTAAFTFFLLYSFLHAQRRFSLALCGAVMYFILSGSLLQPQIVFFLYILIIFFPLANAKKRYRDYLV